MGQKLSGKVVLVTGAASGIGQAAALRVAEEGAITIVADLQETAGNQTVRAPRCQYHCRDRSRKIPRRTTALPEHPD
jgi:NAD(P)-dependent dehydrogenase (short-subunit alcohol dehydrogenase family)